MQEQYDEIPDNYYATVNSDQQSTSSNDLDVTTDSPTGYEGLEAEGLAEFQRREQLPRVYDAMEPRVYVNTTNSDQQSDTSRDVDVTAADRPAGYEGLEAEGLAEFERRQAQEPHVYTAVKPRDYVNTRL